MPFFCEEGQTATVAYPNNLVKEFSNTPIFVDGFTLVSILTTYRRIDTRPNPAPTATLTDSLNYVWDFGDDPNARQIEWYLERGTLGNENIIRIETNGRSGSPPRTEAQGPEIRGFTVDPNFRIEVVSFTIQKPTPLAVSASINRSIVRVIGNNGVINDTGLGNVLLPSYEVECSGCGENELDCGDCCLPCDSVFNAISSMRSQLSRLN